MFLYTNESRVTLNRKVNLVQSLRTDESYELHGISTADRSITQPRKLPRSRLFHEGDYTTFKKVDTVTSISEITKACTKTILLKKSGWKKITAASTS